MNTLTKSLMAIAIVGLLCFNVQAQDSSLKMHLTLDDLDTQDVSGNGNDGIPYCPMAITTDRHGNSHGAMYFDGNADWIEVPGDGIEFQSYTISFWIKKDPQQPGGGAGFPLFQRDRSYIRVESDSNPLIPGRMMALNALVYDFPSSVWTHVVVSYGADGYQDLYINGIHRDRAPFLPLPGKGPLYIGRHDSSTTRNSFAGSLDDIMMFDKVLSKAEVAKLAGIEYQEPEQCIPISEIPECSESQCQESTEVFDSNIQKAKMFFLKKGTKIQVHLDAKDVPDGLMDGAATISVRFIQNGDVIEFIGNTSLIEHGNVLEGR